MLRALTVCVLLWSAIAAKAERHALIIGNADYHELVDLQNTHADAAAYHEVFSQLGFQSTLLNGLGIDETLDALDVFLRKIQPGDEVAFVYSGHGWSDGSENYLSPVDAPSSASDRQQVRASIALRNGHDGVLDELEAAGVSLTVAIIDACRDNPFSPVAGTRSAGLTRGLAPISAPQGTFVIFSAGIGQQALDRLPDDPVDQRLSVFTRAFLPHLRLGLYLEDAISEAQVETFELARSYGGHLQEPAYYDETRGKTCLSETCTQPIALAKPDACNVGSGPIDLGLAA